MTFIDQRVHIDNWLFNTNFTLLHTEVIEVTRNHSLMLNIGHFCHFGHKVGLNWLSCNSISILGLRSRLKLDFFESIMFFNDTSIFLLFAFVFVIWRLLT